MGLTIYYKICYHIKYVYNRIWIVTHEENFQKDKPWFICAIWTAHTFLCMKLNYIASLASVNVVICPFLLNDLPSSIMFVLAILILNNNNINGIIFIFIKSNWQENRRGGMVLPHFSCVKRYITSNTWWVRYMAHLRYWHTFSNQIKDWAVF